MTARNFALKRDVQATLIPAGDQIPLAAGTEVEITQALGGSVTFTARGNLYRLNSEDLDALGEEAVQAFRAGEADAATEGPFSEEAVWQALRGCYDPEIPVNIVDLGLVYDLSTVAGEQADSYRVQVKMTLTARGCGMGPAIAEDARRKIEQIPAVEAAEVEIVWDPQWTPHMISEEGRKALNIDPNT